MIFSIKDFFSKCDQIRRKLRIWSHSLKKSLMENFNFCAVIMISKTCNFPWNIRNKSIDLYWKPIWLIRKRLEHWFQAISGLGSLLISLENGRNSMANNRPPNNIKKPLEFLISSGGTYTSWKYQKTSHFCDVFGSYRKWSLS